MNKLTLNCPINNLGYGITSYNCWKSLRDKVDITLFPISEMQTENHWLKNDLKNDIDKQDNYSQKTPCLKIWHPNDLVISPRNISIYSTYSFFETDRLKKQEILGYNTSDVIFAPTTWAKNIMINNGIDENKISIAPCGVDRSVFNPNINIAKEDEESNQDKYIFLNIGKWEIRKGHDLLVHIFNKAFDIKDNVELWMINHNPFLSNQENQQWQNMYKNSKLGDKIRIFPRLPSQTHVAKMIKLSTCSIYPSRAEGWNNEAIESMSMDKPVILTNYSGHTEYANSENSYLIDIHEEEIAVDGKFFDGSGNWASISTEAIDQTIEHMRHVYKNNIRNNPKGMETASKFSWDNTANQMIKRLYE